MLNTVKENEICLAADYIRRKSLSDSGVCIIGKGFLTDALNATTEYLGEGHRLCRTADEVPEGSKLWYIYDAADPDDGMLLESVMNACVQKRLELTVIVLLKDINRHPAIRRYAEMELIASHPDLIELRKRLKACHYRGGKVKAVFCDRILCAISDPLGLQQLARDAESGVITVRSCDALEYTSALYLPDAITAIYTVSKHGKSGNIYNASTLFLSRYELKSKVYSLFARDGVKLKVEDNDAEISYSALSPGKLHSLSWEPVCDTDDILRYTLTGYITKYDIRASFIRDGYSGKLDCLRKTALSALTELDRICRKHGITYFLSGGSMLGAARHGGFIPWDDDIDVGMLRDEFNRFKAVAASELGDDFSYQSFSNKNGYHYFFDRITVKNTYFASRYSDGYEMPKGISVDIFVYDNVPDDPSKWRGIWKRLMNKRLLMNVRWKNEPRGEGKARLVSKLLLPFLRLRDLDSYSASYDKATRKYEHKATNTIMVPATDHIYRDMMPREWFTEVVPWDFAGVSTFMPKGYDGFLRIWYGEDYMQMLPLYKQTPYHDYYRLDLGDHIDNAEKTPFDFLGELK
ncbi:MAG: LicD family protein [Ruminococcus sp.]|nr:LicD family protein [Ruminococcus sp.]